LRTSQAIPQIHERRDVDFAVGIISSARIDAHPTQSISVGTNLGGAAAGAVIGELSSGLQKYFTDFTSTDVHLPIGGDNRISSNVGIGLGEFTFGKFYVWPVLTMDQFSAEDERMPGDIAASDPDASEWSSPTLAFGVALKRPTTSNGADWIFTASLGFPHYFAGSGLSALAALFSDKRNDFEKSGKVRVAVGLATSIPRLSGTNR
jgi:hypothetical protein